MNVEMVAQNEETVLIRLVGNLDLASSAELKRRVATALAAGRKRLVVDLGRVPAIDSSGLAALVSTLKACRQSGGAMMVASPSSQVQYVIRLAGLDRVIQICASAEEALVQIDERHHESLLLSGDLSEMGRLRGALARLSITAEKLAPGSAALLQQSFGTVAVEIAADVLRNASPPGEAGALFVDLVATPNEVRAVLADQGKRLTSSPDPEESVTVSVFDAAARGLDGFQFDRLPREGHRWTLRQRLVNVAGAHLGASVSDFPANELRALGPAA